MTSVWSSVILGVGSGYEMRCVGSAPGGYSVDPVWITHVGQADQEPVAASAWLGWKWHGRKSGWWRVAWVAEGSRKEGFECRPCVTVPGTPSGNGAGATGPSPLTLTVKQERPPN